MNEVSIVSSKNRVYGHFLRGSKLGLEFYKHKSRIHSQGGILYRDRMQ